MLNYSLGKGRDENWVVSEVKFSPDALGKCEAIMYLGNGYMGVRSATEEPYIGEKRNWFVAGTFNRFAESEVTELPNLPDVTRLDIRVDGERFHLLVGETKDYVRQLNLRTAELIRTFDWTSPKGKTLRFRFRRFVSLADLHVLGMKMEVEALNGPVEISVKSGIDGQQTNSGTQHFHEGEKRIFDRQYIQMIARTIESDIDFVINTAHRVTVAGKPVNEPNMSIGRRQVHVTYQVSLDQGETLDFEKITTVHTSRDKEFDDENYELKHLREVSLNHLKEVFARGYDGLFTEHVKCWQEKVWGRYNLQVDSEDPFDQLAMRFALYHLTVMTPAHDERMGVAAKGLSGEGYKGHSFWDTEIFILPFFTFSNPEVAKSLLKYRYHGLAGARRKAKENGYEGAMYPWEAAWPTDGEVTPRWGAVDVVTGEQTPIWTGLIEQHISADIAFAVYQYYQVTGDEEFMNDCGYEIIFDTARFWLSRLEWDEEKQEYHINNVIGPDEYKEHVDNNAYTNYMAHFNIQLAIQYYEKLQKENPELLQALDEKIAVQKTYEWAKAEIDKIYLPQPRKEDLVIPQDDTYLTLKNIDLTKYKASDRVGTLFDEYNMEQVNQMQVTKQADVVLLLYLLEQIGSPFAREVVQANFEYYEPRTTHDSSLSLSTHTIVANDIGDEDLAYSLFQRAARIDLGPYMHSSDEGIHAASIGGIWQSAVFGFAGLRLVDGKLRINPRLPKQWKKLEFTIYWQGQPLSISLDHSVLRVKAENKEKVSFEVFGTTYETDDHIEISI